MPSSFLTVHDACPTHVYGLCQYASVVVCTSARVLQWRVIAFSLCFLLSDLGGAPLSAVLERRYGEHVPIFQIQSINLWGCLCS